MPPNIDWFTMLIMHYLMTTVRYATIRVVKDKVSLCKFKGEFMFLIWNDIFQRTKNKEKHSQDVQGKYLEPEDLDSVNKVSFK